MASNNLSIPRGDTFLASAVYKDTLGNPVDLDAAGIAVTASVRDPSGKVSIDIPVTVKNQITNPGEFTLKSLTSEWTGGSGQQTSAWLVRIHYDTVDGRFSSAVATVNLEP